MNFDLMFSQGFANSGGYFILRKDGSISHTNEKPENLTIIDQKYVEELLFRNALEVIQRFAKTEHNKDVYVVAIDVTTEHLELNVYINTLSGLEKSYEYYGKRDKHLIYLTGDFEYMYTHEIPDEADWLSMIHSSIYYGWEPLELKEDIAVKNEIFDEEIIKMGLRVTEKLEKETHILNKTNDFIMFYCDHDMDYFYNDEYKKKYDDIYDDLK